jgi:hypothetical protein
VKRLTGGGDKIPETEYNMAMQGVSIRFQAGEELKFPGISFIACLHEVFFGFLGI